MGQVRDAAVRTERRDLTRGDGPYACWRIGPASACPVSPMRAIAGFPCQIPTRPWNFLRLIAAPKSSACRASRAAQAWL